MVMFLPPLAFMPFALYPAGLLFHVVVFITKSNILLCRHCHLSPPACDFPCMCVYVCVDLCIMKASAPPMELWQGVWLTQRHMCRNPAALLSATGQSFVFCTAVQSSRGWSVERRGWGGSQRKMKLRYGLHKCVSASMCRPGRRDWHTLSDTSVWMHSYTHCL